MTTASMALMLAFQACIILVRNPSVSNVMRREGDRNVSHEAAVTDAGGNYELREFAKAHKLPFALARVKPGEADGWLGETFAAYSVKSVPRAFLIDREGVLQYEGDGSGIEQHLGRRPERPPAAVKE